MTGALLDSLNDPVVRDLAGVMGAPGLLAPVRPEIISDAECARTLADQGERLRALDQDPSELRRWLEEQHTSHLLGRYFEALLGFWIRHLLQARRLEAGLKIQRERQVIGELDFVFEDAIGHLMHWEASVKFYLCTADKPEGGRETSSFLGTMTKDRLDKKMALLFERQLGMPLSPEGREALLRAGFDGAPRSRLFMKGALFYPIERDWRRHPFPPEVSAAHLRGWWSKELPPGDHWVVLDRRRWLSPFRGAPEFRPLGRGEMLERIAGHFGGARTAFMLAQVGRRSDGYWGEDSRGLVVHPGWPWRVIG